MILLRRRLSRGPGDARFNERGQLDPLTGLILLGTMVALGLGFGAAINYASSELSGPGAPPPIQILEPKTFFVPPDNDCARRVLASFSGDVRWLHAGVWQLVDRPTPRVPFQPTKDEIKEYNGRVSAWNGEASVRVGAVYARMKELDCFTAQQPIANPPTSPPEPTTGPTVDISGTYPLNQEGLKGDDGFCRPYDGSATSVTVSGVAYPATVNGVFHEGSATLVFGGSLGSLRFTIQMDTSLSYSSTGDLPRAPASDQDHLNLLGQFITSGGTVRVTGQLYSSVCALSYTGLKS